MSDYTRGRLVRTFVFFEGGCVGAFACNYSWPYLVGALVFMASFLVVWRPESKERRDVRK